MKFVNLNKSFLFEGMNFQFSYYDAENQDKPDLNVFSDNDIGKNYLSKSENYARVVSFVVNNFIEGAR